jgi:hypothetical protein
MLNILILILVLHVLAAAFWFGSTATLARLGGERAEQLFVPQMAAAAVAIASGVVLAGFLHRGGLGAYQVLLPLGALCALAAATVQWTLIGRARRALSRATPAGHAAEVLALRRRMALGERIAAGLLAVTLMSMTALRYV